MTASSPLAVRLSEFAAAHRDALPADVEASCVERTLDILGLCIAATSLDTSSAVAGFVAAQGTGGSETAIGLGRAHTAWAAFHNGVLAHSLDYDDTHLPSVLHPSASVVPAALAVAQREGRTGREFLGALAVGIEICVRLGMAGYDRSANTSVYFEHGQHATSICGAVGSAAAAALLTTADANAERVQHAMGIAVSMASGIIESNRAGGTVKRLHCGWAAHAGVVASDLARAGLTGPATALDGRFGFFEAFLHGRVFPDEAERGLGTSWEVPGIFFKPYPANHFTHAVVDAGRELRSRGVRPEDVRRATIGVAAPTVRTIGEPIERKRDPRTSYEAQFSGPYALTVGLFGGGGLGASLADYSVELVRDPARRRLMSTIDVTSAAVCDVIFPRQFPCVVTVETMAGDRHVVEVLTNRGGPDRPLSEQELSRKFRDNAGVLPPEVTAAIEDAVRSLPDAPTVEGALRGLEIPLLQATTEVGP
jgi:2-methylcitrate dehydratase PrpD